MLKKNGKLGIASAVAEWQKVCGPNYVLRFWARIQNQSTVLQLWIGHFQAKKVANNVVTKKEWFACFLSAASTGVKAGCMWTDRLVLGWELNWVPPGCEVGVGLLCNNSSPQERVKQKRSRFGQKFWQMLKQKRLRFGIAIHWMPEDCEGLVSGSEIWIWILVAMSSGDPWGSLLD